MKEQNLIIENLKAILEECTASEDAVSYVNSEDAGTLKAAIEALEKQEQNRWIPVTERLPEKDGHYLVTLFDEIDSWTEPLYWNTTFGGRWQGLIEDDFSDIGNVSAWKLLPEPYKEEEEA